VLHLHELREQHGLRVAELRKLLATAGEDALPAVLNR
jgi:hypothetical protein